jgi:hypothetical protein
LDGDGDGDGVGSTHKGSIFDTNLASMHTYLGEVDDVGSSRLTAQGGSMVTLPMFYLEGVVLFPEQKLPLRVLQPRFKAAVVRAMQQEDNDAPYTLGVVFSCPFIAISFNFLHIYMDLVPVVIVNLLFFKLDCIRRFMCVLNTRIRALLLPLWGPLLRSNN